LSVFARAQTAHLLLALRRWEAAADMAQRIESQHRARLRQHSAKRPKPPVIQGYFPDYEKTIRKLLA
jgi:hypothetical protein